MPNNLIPFHFPSGLSTSLKRPQCGFKPLSLRLECIQNLSGGVEAFSTPSLYIEPDIQYVPVNHLPYAPATLGRKKCPSPHFSLLTGGASKSCFFDCECSSTLHSQNSFHIKMVDVFRYQTENKVILI